MTKTIEKDGWVNIDDKYILVRYKKIMDHKY
jgi:hypothetical protein